MKTITPIKLRIKAAIWCLRGRPTVFGCDMTAPVPFASTTRHALVAGNIIIPEDKRSEFVFKDNAFV